jgi:beta-lactamase regulating signal transducer with metallopeptidase domain
MSPLEIGLKSLCLATVGLAALALLKRASAATRHLMLTIVLVGLCALPVMTALAPAWRIPFLRVVKSAPPREEAVSLQSTPSFQSERRISPDQMILDAWISISAVLTVLVLWRLIRLRVMEQQFQMAEGSTLSGAVAGICRESGMRVLLLQSDESATPMTWGLSRPVLLMPASATEWSQERLRAVVLHELAHIRRKDWIVSLGAEFACAWLWFNPLVWLLRKRIEIESESAADDQVLEAGISAPNYAAHLVDVLKELKAFPKAATTAQAFGRPGKLDRRIRAILEESRSRRPLRGSVTLGSVAAFAVAASTVAAAAPTIIIEQQWIAGPPSPALVVHQPVRVESKAAPFKPIASARLEKRTQARNRAPEVNVQVPDAPVSTPRLSGPSDSHSLMLVAKESHKVKSGKPSIGDDFDPDDVSAETPELPESATREIQKALVEANHEARKQGFDLNLSLNAKKGEISFDLGKLPGSILSSATKALSESLKDAPPTVRSHISVKAGH